MGKGMTRDRWLSLGQQEEALPPFEAGGCRPSRRPVTGSWYPQARHRPSPARHGVVPRGSDRDCDHPAPIQPELTREPGMFTRSGPRHTGNCGQLRGWIGGCGYAADRCSRPGRPRRRPHHNRCSAFCKARVLSVFSSGNQGVRLLVSGPGLPDRMGLDDHGSFDGHHQPWQPIKMLRR